MSDIYQYVDETGKQDTNCLTVDFHFSGDISAEEAEAIIDKLVATSDYDQLYVYNPTIFTVSRYSSIAETL
jgi:hypothetical protein